jgi:hypothetical protein
MVTLEEPADTDDVRSNLSALKTTPDKPSRDPVPDVSIVGESISRFPEALMFVSIKVMKF